ncbi:MAG: response regulator [Anaerolineales bacterium]|nr:response regulator [Anaerolineales bacterium]
MASENGSGPVKRVLVIEDDADFRTLVALMLAETHLDVRYAVNGQTGLAAIRDERPDLVILDLMLPDMSGWDVFMAMRDAPASAGIPVIILSSVGTRHDRSFGLQVAQVHDYVTKPCLPSRLRAAVASALA